MQPMQPFTIKVLGGQFTVHQIVQQSEQSLSDTINMMLTVPAERWFVVLDDPLGDNPRDALALIDDELAFQNMATGVFEGDE